MTKTRGEGADLMQLATEMMVAAQAAGVQVLEAEIKALAQAMPGGEQVDPLPTEAEVEAGFDNMPV